ncbi:hypothetical protein [Rhodanobacter terrae]|uniref:Uncharacterized protein n=1 Tax=Rhodanobacter terrae TaxID=418647 RepID=A0ABW0T4C2_9GAMM
MNDFAGPPFVRVAAPSSSAIRTKKRDGKMNYVAPCMVLLALLGFQRAEAASFKDPTSFVATLKQGGQELTYESTPGDFQGSGKDDVAVLVHFTGAAQRGYQLAILGRNQVNAFDLLEISKFGDSSNGIDAKIAGSKGGSLFISIESPAGYWGTYQFKFLGHAMTLIGSEIHLSSCQSGQELCKSVDTSTNFLTGEVVFHRKMIGGAGDKSSWSKEKLNLTHCVLSNFDFSPYYCVQDVDTGHGMLDALMRGEK